MTDEQPRIEIPIEVDERLVAAVPGAVGQLAITRREGEWAVEVKVRPGLTAGQRHRFARWVGTSLVRIIEGADPGEHGWAPSDYVDGRWYMTAVEHMLPTMP